MVLQGLTKWASSHSSVLREVACENKTTTISTEHRSDCANWKRETKSLWNIIIPNWLILFPIKKASSVELHMSCSAKWGYEAIVYVKTIIVPLKTMMRPRRKKANGCCNSITNGQTSCVY
ncbi:hypothetical protein T4B_7946 [Trichinella pseudospiralis]|uniref:Uncharacterized protein n=1 Tax=Trichinella pseudospiralis TaxID=6337 RepID=A0A0V1J5Q8_TRIPS|nr:hypothetical protein T4B_7946 [Trichinella pseudospiralis]KRZ30307.1 hypothetical protein T4C_10199 [Trichinella pseudospiralis]